ncbi:MAG: endonuclease [Bacteroidales bacterium]
MRIPDTMRPIDVKRLFLFASLFLVLFSSCFKEDSPEDPNGGDIEIPEGDYIQGKKERNLKSAWNQKLTAVHIHQSYAEVWRAFYTTDVRADGYVADLYGGPTTNYKLGSDQQGTSLDPDSYNREHSFPKSWFGTKDQDYDLYTDLFNLYPSDATANSRRSNFPFGEIQGTALWTNTYCKLGNMTAVGFSGKVFEPNDEIKGDLARTYFYIATRYEKENFSSWGSSGAQLLTYSAYPFFKSWQLNLLLKWHRADPVSEKERKRNEAVKAIQGNRNPYIDYPELVEYIWGTLKEKPFYYIHTAQGKEIFN